MSVLALVAAAGLQTPSVRQALATGQPATAAAGSTPTTAVPTDPAPEPTVATPSATPSATPTATPTATSHSTSKASPAPTRVRVPAKGTGGYRQAKLTERTDRTKGRLIRFDVRVENGMPFDAAATARFVAGVLDDDRSWAGSGRWRFELVDDPAEAELHAWIVSPTTTDRKCYPLLTRGQVSCQNGNDVVLNATRWGLGADAYGTDLVGYRTYLVNHEFGHYLGYQHVGCPGRGKRAPVMMQQTKSVGSCRPNSWPAPDRD